MLCPAVNQEMATGSPWANLPADVLAAVDKMANFKVRNGESFEALIREKQANDPRFAFLFDTTSAAHAYYQYRLATLYAAAPQPMPLPQQMPLPQGFGNPGGHAYALLPHLQQQQQQQQYTMPAVPTQLPRSLPHMAPPPPASMMPPGAYYAPPPPMPPAAPPPPAAPLSALQCPVGFLATILREREENAARRGERRRPGAFMPLRRDDLPRALPSRVAPQALCAIPLSLSHPSPGPMHVLPWPTSVLLSCIHRSCACARSLCPWCCVCLCLSSHRYSPPSIATTQARSHRPCEPSRSVRGIESESEIGIGGGARARARRRAAAHARPRRRAGAPRVAGWAWAVALCKTRMTGRSHPLKLRWECARMGGGSHVAHPQSCP